MVNLKVAFVGQRRDPKTISVGYLENFIKFHMELPYYYAAYSNCESTVVFTDDLQEDLNIDFPGGGSLRAISERVFNDENREYDVAVHWRRYYDNLHVDGARNVMLSQDHSFSPEWLAEVRTGYDSGRLEAILVFPTWHKENTAKELGGMMPTSRLYEGLTFGVDTSVYEPIGKDPFQLLWASDPGRGLDRLVGPFLNLWSRDRRFRLNVVYPDYVKKESMGRFSQFLSHPGVKHIGPIQNGPKLWNLFNSCGFLPYSSTFPEPSSRCHRQMMAAGGVVLYPPGMGTPSRMIENGLTGIVEHPDSWADAIIDLVRTGRWEEIGTNARSYAVSENWAVQAGRFHRFFTGEKK